MTGRQQDGVGAGSGDPSLRRWEIVGLVSLAVIVVAVPLSLVRTRVEPQRPLEAIEATFVGGESCRDCHATEFERWTGSDHDKAMDIASDSTVRGDFDDAIYSDGRVTSRFYRRDGAFLVSTEGSEGEIEEFEITHVFGHEPLQQYLIPFPGGRLQTLNVTWDAERGEWYRQYPDQEILAGDWLHWTRAGQNWNGMCAECHSTNLRKNYDPAADSYDTTWTDIDVNCEACHGPGSRHVAWAEIAPMARPDLQEYGLAVTTSRISPRATVELCAPCHSRRGELGDYDHTGAELLDHMLPSLLREGLYHADGQLLDEVYVYGSFLQSKMYAREVSCPDCHDSHSLQLHKDGNELCLQCHERQTYDTRDHHFHQQVYEGRPSDGARCVKCHMVEQRYMVIDWRADHSFRIPRPDLSAVTGAPNACEQSGCHADQTRQWSIDAYRRWYGQARKPHFGTTFVAARRGDEAARPELMRLAETDLVAPIVRATALELLARSPDPDGVATLRAAVDSEEPLLRHAAGANLPLLERGDVERLAVLLSDPVKAVRISVVPRLARAPREFLRPYQRDAFDVALQEYREALSHSLDFAASAHNLGNLESSLGNAAAAERYYRQALAIDDLFTPSKANLAVMLSGQGRNEEAERLLREILRDDPADGQSMYSLGLLRVERGDPADGVLWLSRAAEAMPGDVRVHRNLGLLLQQMGRLDEAGAALRRAYELQPDTLDIMHVYADHLLRRGRLDEAATVADRMIELHPDQPIGQQVRAAIDAQR